MTASMSAPFHNASSTDTAQGLRRHGLRRLRGALRRRIARKCLRGALPARGAKSAVRPDACAARCAHAAARAPRECVETWVSNNEDAALVASKGCHQSVDAFFHGSQTDTLSVLIHLQKTGGWSVVGAARAAGVRCPSVIANADGRRSTEHLDGCAGYRASTPQDEGLLRASVVGQQAVLAAHHRMFGLLHVEQPLSRVWPAFLGTRHVLYVTVLRDPLKRALSHFKMATREVHIPGIYSGLPFGRTASSRNSRTGRCGTAYCVRDEAARPTGRRATLASTRSGTPLH